MKPGNRISEKLLTSVFIQLAAVILLPVIGLIAIDQLIIHPLATNNHISTKLAMVLIIVPKLIVLIWIGSSILRFTDNHYKKYGSATIKTSLLICLFLSVLAVSVSAIDAIQFFIFTEKSMARDSQNSAPVYHLSADLVNQEYSIEGTIDFGISSDFRLLLKQHPGGKRVILTSLGGSIYEGRGLAVVIQDHQLDTHVNDECSSACTLAFIGGQRRTLGASAKLGFHQYLMDYSNRHQVLPFHDPVKEQEHDSVFMLQRGISKEFVDRVFDQLHQDIWFPDNASLVRFGVVHSIR